MRDRGIRSVVFFSVIASLSIAQPALAKHRPQPQSTNSDPCAAPNAYVREHIKKIKALQALAPNANGNLFDMFNGKGDFEAKRSIEIAQLRYDADGVNALLAAGGCQSFDLDHELSQGAK
jgi:hypothetical protein